MKPPNWTTLWVERKGYWGLKLPRPFIVGVAGRWGQREEQNGRKGCLFLTVNRKRVFKLAQGVLDWELAAQGS